MSLLGWIFSFLFLARKTAKASQVVRRGSPFRRRSSAGAARQRRDFVAVRRRTLETPFRDEECSLRPMKFERDRSDASPSGGVRSDEDLGRERDGGGVHPGNGLIKSWCVGRVVPRPRQHAVAPIMHVSMQTAVQNPNRSQPIKYTKPTSTNNQSPINQSRKNTTSYP